LGVTFWLFAVIFTLAPIWPHVYYRLSPGTSETLAQTLGTKSISSPKKVPDLKDPISNIKSNLPPLDKTLPTENGLIIDKIGVRGELHEGTDYSSILKTGLWHVPDFGTPENNQQPIIIAAHRWGYLSWTNSFRTLNSFYNLPKLKVGDKVEIIWNQRKYVYEIYQEETGTKITDYGADLILYTCELWNSPTRIFKYAKRVT
jgi:LPXTG-site transpeptidase (sortase) family protein